MSQSGIYAAGGTPPVGSILTLTGDTGGAVGPTTGNINIVGGGIISVAGNPGTSTLTISATGAGAEQFDTDAGNATPSAGVLNVFGGLNINTAGVSDTVLISLDDTVSITGSLTVGTTLGFIRAVTGDISAEAGNLNLPTTTSAGDEGVITINAVPYIHNLGDNVVLGQDACNFGLTLGTAVNNVFVGQEAGANITTANNNVGIGRHALNAATTSTISTAVGTNALAQIVTGTGNVVFGTGAGFNYTSSESNNLLLGNPGVLGENNTLRIGVSGVGTLEQSNCYIAGIRGNSPSMPQMVVIGPDDKLGSQAIPSVSSLQFDADTGIAVPSLGVLNVNGDTNIATVGSSNNLTIQFSDNPTVTGTYTTTGGNIELPSTNTGATQGIIIFNSNRWISNYGNTNTFIGQDSGNTTLITGSSDDNVAVGANALQSLLTGQDNIGVGSGALQANDTGTQNTAIGAFAGNANQAGGANTFIGANAALVSTSSSNDIIIGTNAYTSYTGNGANVVIGVEAAPNLLTGTANVIIGTQANGDNYTSSESSNVLIQSLGVTGESHTIRIGNPGNSFGEQNRCFIAGITGVTITGGAAVLCDGNGQLGTVVSSLKYKENIEDINSVSESLLKCRPVKFNYKNNPAIHYGLIAEEVNEIFPELVLKNNLGDIESVAYHEMPALLLNELKKCVIKIEELEKKIENFSKLN